MKTTRAFLPDGTPRDFTPDQVEDWQYEVANGDTVLGLALWCQHHEEATATEAALTTHQEKTP